MDQRWLEVKNVLVVRLDNFGDVLLSTPAIRAIKETLPGVKVTLLASAAGAQVAELDPDIDDVIVYEAPWMDVWQCLPQDSQREQEMIARIRAQRFDGAVIFTSSWQSPLPAAYMCYVADVPLRLAISTDRSGSLLTTCHRPPPLPIVHEVQRALDLVGTVGFHSRSDDLVLKVDTQLRASVLDRLASEGMRSEQPLAVIHPGCNTPARTYPWDGYAEIADLLDRRLGCQIVFTGSSSEAGLVQRIQQRMTRPSLNWVGRSTFRGFAGLVAVADIVITNNTGPQHLAAALKTPEVVLFALTSPPEQWGPWRVPHRLLYHQVPCAFCQSRICPTDHACLRQVTPEAVVSAAEELLAERRLQ
ncbi:MAG: glycosyltransferase family 9 protein [Chloroflexi bacterium]|nr:glycosyltransferase family 9 protein [Chloroflexota bacterium]